MWQPVLDLIGKVPDVVWAAVLASLLTLGGVWLTSRNSRLQQIAALRHDACQREREREMSLRKEVYGPAVEAIASGYHALSRFTNLSLSLEELTAECSKHAGAMARIDVIGTNGTIQAISALSNELEYAFLELMLKRIPLIDRKNEIDMLTRFIDKSFEEQDRYLELMKQLSIGGQGDERVWAVVTAHLEFEKDQNAKRMQQREQLWAQQSREHFEFTERCNEYLTEASRFVPPVLFALLDELELPLDREAYMKNFHANLERTKEMLLRMMAEFKRYVDD
jgi:hypothetical protein